MTDTSHFPSAVVDPVFGEIDNIPMPTGEGEGFAEDFKPAPGPYVVTVSRADFFRSKRGELTLAVDYKLDNGQSWGDVRVITKNGQVQEGRVRAARVMLRQLGLDGNAQAGQWKGLLSQIIGSRYFVEVVQNGEYLNTNVTGRDQAAAPMPTAQSMAAPVAAPAIQPQAAVPQQVAAPAANPDGIPF